jgi:D-alanine-D-alanine ligase
LRITVLTDVEQERQDPRASDPVVPQVADALAAAGHRVDVLGVHADVRRFVAALDERKPELVFNLLETFGEDLNGDIGVAGLMDLLGVRYTGCGPGELYLANDKALAKKMLAFEGLKYPNFAMFGGGAELETGGNLRMPLFVKPARMDASIGIDAGGLVHDATALMKRVALIHDELGVAALAEEYIDGRELYVGVLGNEQPEPLPPIEIDFSRMPAGTLHILDAKAKFDEDSPEYRGTKAVVADLPVELRARLHKVAVGAYRALRVRDYGRVDLRLAPDGEIYVLEVNAGAYLERESELAMAARAGGIDHAALIARIVELARARHGM